LEEEKRLCYVAMTRAKTELFMTWRQETRQFTKDGIRTINRKRSRFLDILVGKSGKDAKSNASSSKPALDRNNYGARQYTTGQNNPPSSYSKTPYSARRPLPYPSRPKPVVVPPPRFNELDGTSRVYAKRKASPVERPLENQTPARQQQVPSRAAQPVANQPPRRQQQGPISKATATQSTTVKPKAPRSKDSTWFFPVGSAVVHKSGGKGVVLPPPSGRDPETGDILVRVKFDSGDTRNYSVSGSDISPA
jgi:ATP-dependent exoDNAse (exonuclease V) beta subunit